MLRLRQHGLQVTPQADLQVNPRPQLGVPVLQLQLLGQPLGQLLLVPVNRPVNRLQPLGVLHSQPVFQLLRLGLPHSTPVSQQVNRRRLPGRLLGAPVEQRLNRLQPLGLQITIQVNRLVQPGRLLGLPPDRPAFLQVNLRPQLGVPVLQLQPLGQPLGSQVNPLLSQPLLHG